MPVTRDYPFAGVCEVKETECLKGTAEIGNGIALNESLDIQDIPTNGCI
jgi:hypothetical protein